MKKKKEPAPINIRASLKHDQDVSHFAEDFTKQQPEDRPAERPTNKNAQNFFRGKLFFTFEHSKILTFCFLFRKGYSFVSPELMKSKEFITNNPKESMERPNADDIFELQRNVSYANNGIVIVFWLIKVIINNISGC